MFRKLIWEILIARIGSLYCKRPCSSLCDAAYKCVQATKMPSDYRKRGKIPLQNRKFNCRKSLSSHDRGTFFRRSVNFGASEFIENAWKHIKNPFFCSDERLFIHNACCYGCPRRLIFTKSTLFGEVQRVPLLSVRVFLCFQRRFYAFYCCLCPKSTRFLILHRMFHVKNEKIQKILGDVSHETLFGINWLYA